MANDSRFPHLARQLHDFYDRIGRGRLDALTLPNTREDWAGQKPALRQALADAIGFRPEIAPRLEAERLGRTQREGYSVERIVFHGWPRSPISANLYVPYALGAPAPAVAAPHGHSMDGKAHGVYQCCYINLARRGYVVLAWDMIGHGEREPMGHRDGCWPLLAGLSLKGLLLMEGHALVTWLGEQPEVDAARMGCTGNSGGGAQTLLLAALDTRIAAAAPAGHVGPITFIADKEKNLCPCTLLPRVTRFVEIEHVLGLIAPRHAMIVAGRDDCLFPDDLVRRSHRLGLRAYALDGVPERLELHISACGHGYEQPKREGMYAFFDRTLKGEDVERAAEPPTEPEPTDSLALRCWRGPRPDFWTVRDLSQHLASQLDLGAAPVERLWPDALGIDELPTVANASWRASDDGWERVVLQLSHRVDLPALVARPQADAAEGTIVVDDLGKESARAQAAADDARVQGRLVVALDLLGWGETKPAELNPVRGDDETFAAQRGLFFGRPLVGERAAELVAVTRWVASELGVRSVAWQAFGWAGLPAVLGSGLEPKPQHVRVHGLPIRSFWDECEPRRPLFSFPHGILRVGDLDSLASERVVFER